MSPPSDPIETAVTTDERKDDTSSQPPLGQASLARRIAGWTSNGLLTAIILVAGLGLGRQVLQWWSVEEARPAIPWQYQGDRAMGDRARLHQLTFGETGMTMATRTVEAEEEELADLLVRQCRETTPEGTAPLGPISPGERDLLASLAQCKPALEEPGRWRIYHVDGDGFVPLAVMTQPTKPAERDRIPPSTGGEDVAEPVWRVVSWTLGMPGQPPVWTLSTFHATPTAAREPETVAAFELPPDSQRIMAAQVGAGTAWLAFRGESDVGHWKGFFDRAFPEGKWSRAVCRRTASGGWHLQYLEIASKARRAVDIRFGPGTEGHATGLLTCVTECGATQP